MVFANTVCVGAFGPLLPDIARAQALPDWQIGILAGSFGFARMVSDLPTGVLVGRRLGSSLAAAPILLIAGTLLLWTASAFPLLVLGRVLVGFGHSLGMVAGLTAILLDPRGGGSLRLNAFEFAGMAGVLGGLISVAALPSAWPWPRTLLVACAPVLVTIAIVPSLRRQFPDGAMPGALPTAAASPLRPASRTPPIVWFMFAVGAIMGLVWSSISQFLLPLRGTREFGLDRAGVSQLLGIAQVVDLVALLPVGWLADRLGRPIMLALLLGALGVGAWGAGLGTLPIVIAGCVLLGVGMAGWMFPLAMIREHTDAATFAWRTGLYRVGVDAAAFVGPLVCGFIGERHTGRFVGVLGLCAVAAAAWLGRGRVAR